MNQIMVLGVLIAVAVFVINYIAWGMAFQWPSGAILAFVVGSLLVAPIIAGFRIKKKTSIKYATLQS